VRHDSWGIESVERKRQIDRTIDRNAEACANKAKYTSKAQAMWVFRYYKRTVPKKRGRRVEPIKHEQLPYKCPHCGGWHLSRVK